MGAVEESDRAPAGPAASGRISTVVRGTTRRQGIRGASVRAPDCPMALSARFVRPHDSLGEDFACNCSRCLSANRFEEAVASAKARCQAVNASSGAGSEDGDGDDGGSPRWGAELAHDPKIDFEPAMVVLAIGPPHNHGIMHNFKRGNNCRFVRQRAERFFSMASTSAPTMKWWIGQLHYGIEKLTQLAYFDAGTAQSAVTLWRRTVVKAGGGGAGVSSACPSFAGSLSDGQVRELYRRINGANRNESAGGDDDSRGRPSLPDNAGGSLPQPTLHRVRRRRRRRRAASGRTDSSSYSAGVRRGLERTGLRLEATMPRRRLPSSPQQKGGSVTGRRMRERRKRGSGNKRAADPTRRRTKRRR